MLLIEEGGRTGSEQGDVFDRKEKFRVLVFGTNYQEVIEKPFAFNHGVNLSDTTAGKL